jgi:hypothetical protein
MFEIKNSLKDIKKSNYVYFIKEKKELKNLDFLSLDKKIIKKIEDTLS